MLKIQEIKKDIGAHMDSGSSMHRMKERMSGRLLVCCRQKSQFDTFLAQKQDS